MTMAEVVAGRSICSRLGVGAVITSADGFVIATGRNGPPGGYPHNDRPCVEWCPRAGTIHWELTSQGEDLPDFCRPYRPTSSDYDDCPSLHAEANALLTSERSQRLGGRIYITSDPCFGCAKLIANSGIGFVIVRHNEEHAEARGSRRGYELLGSCGLAVGFYDSRPEVPTHWVHDPYRD